MGKLFSQPKQVWLEFMQILSAPCVMAWACGYGVGSVIMVMLS